MIKGFITNLGKYNEGMLIGEWIDFPIDNNDLQAVLERIGIDEQYEEYFFTDWESDIDAISDYFGEYPDIDDVNELADTIESFNEYQTKIFVNACELWSISEILENDMDDYSLLFDVTSDYELGYYWIEESGCYDTSKLGNLSSYIDYESFGRDVRMESNGGFCSDGYIEYIG